MTTRYTKNKRGKPIEPGRRSTAGANALTVIEALITLAVLLILAWLFLLGYLPQRTRSPIIDCQNNFKQVGLSIRQWALDNNNNPP
jgi:hypothetical protein